MRVTPVALSIGIALATIASAGNGQRPDDRLDPRSTALTQQAQSLLAGGQLDQATDLLESALAVDPRNRSAYVTLGRVAQAQKLPGKAVRFYSEALKLDPNDPNALGGEGEAFVDRGAVERAKLVLDRLKTVCRAPCPQASALAAAIAKGPPPEAVAAHVPAPPPNKSQD